MTHPITPLPELVQQWAKDRVLLCDRTPLHEYIATRAAQWGADQELEACCKALDMVNGSTYWSQVLRSGRRPKPPSLKEQALGALDRMWNGGSTKADWELFRLALEALPDD
jgi:hypothetical protein